MDYMDTVNFAYNRWKSAQTWGDTDGETTFAPQGVAEISLNDDTLPFLKIAVMRCYMMKHGNDSLE